MKVLIFSGLFLGFLLLFQQMELLRKMEKFWQKTRGDMEASARLRVLEERQHIREFQRKHSFWWKIDRNLKYSGLSGKYPRLTAEWWIAGNLLVAGVGMLGAFSFWGIWQALAVGLGEGLFAEGVLRVLRYRNLKRVNDNLLKLLDFLGNYSITCGELTGVLGQVGRYMETPISDALENCCYEAKTTGDASRALAVMAEEIEHPKFKELARNMEISVRYCADFSSMVNSSRKSMREYLRALQERKSMMREALIQMLLLAGMSVVMLATVSRLVGLPLPELLAGSLPGRIGMAGIFGMFLLFALQIQKLQE